MINGESTSRHNVVFWFHVVITILAWIGPFLFSWFLLVPAYILVLLQFTLFKRCLLNAGHHLSDSGDTTFYSYLFEKIGWRVNKAKLKKWVRQYFYIILALFTLMWQVILGLEPLLF